ncbi:cytochrome P450 [bacterium]|nr:cytochrome P450 [bacterium]
MTESRRRQPPGLNGPISWKFLTQSPLTFINGLAEQYGPVARFDVAWYRYHVLSHPDHVLRVLQERAGNYTKETHDYWLMKQIMGTSLLTGDGNLWKQRRRLIQPLFQRRQLEHMAIQTVAATDAMLERWLKQTRDGAPLEMVSELVQLTLRVVGRTLFSTDLVDEAPAVGTAVHSINELANWNWKTLVAMIPVLNYPYQRASGVLNQLIQSLVTARKSDLEPSGDLLTALVQARDEETGQPLTDIEIRNEAMTLMLAGHDTTAHHLAWTMILLAQHPQVMEKWQAELQTVLGDCPPTLADLPRLSYTRMIVEESMRLYPPVWAIPRAVTEDDELSGYHIPAGSYVLLAIYHLQRDPQWWTNPNEFRPERFDRAIEPAPRPGAYAPFGWGPRTCVGAQFATAESQVILARLGQRCQWKLVPGQQIVPEGLITLMPRNGVRMQVQPRV